MVRGHPSFVLLLPSFEEKNAFLVLSEDMLPHPFANSSIKKKGIAPFFLGL